MKIKEIILRKSIIVIAIFAMLLQTFAPMMEMRVKAAGDVNFDIGVLASTPSISSGDTAIYEFELAVTGSTTTYTDVNLVIDLPNSQYATLLQPLSELSIAGVTPTHDVGNNRLTYAIPVLETGKTYRFPISFSTNNGVTPNNAKLDITVKATGANVPSSANQTASINVVASGNISITKSAVRVNSNPPGVGDQASWNIGVTSSKRDTGSLYIKEGSKITVVDTLPAGLTYVSDNAGGVYNAAQRTVTWQFDAPSHASQTATSQGNPVFTKTIQLVTKVEDDVKNWSVLQNNVAVSGSYFGDVPYSATASATMTVAGNNEEEYKMDGAHLIPVASGPTDNVGGTNYQEGLTKQLPFYDTAYLAFDTQLFLLEQAETGQFESLYSEYLIDPKLRFESALLFDSNYRFARTYTERMLNIPLDVQPDVAVEVKINGVWTTKIAKLPSRPESAFASYTRADLGISPTDHVEGIRLNYGAAPAALWGMNMRAFFTVQPGAVGEVNNFLVIHGVNGRGENFRLEGFDRATATGRFLAGADIIPQPTGSASVVTTSIDLINTIDGSVVAPGPNRVKSEFLLQNGPTLNNPYAMILLPPGVTVASNPNTMFTNRLRVNDANGGNMQVIDSNHNGTGMQLVRVNWNDISIGHNQKITVAFDVMIANDAIETQFEVFGFSSNSSISAPSYSDNSITNTVIQTNTDNLDRSGNTNAQRARSANRYEMIERSSVTTNMQVKGELDTEYSRMGNTTLGGDIAYKFNVSNERPIPVQNLTIYNVLPSVGDLGITDNVTRDSKFTPTLNGPITLPAGMEDLFDVSYSTSTNPNRDDLMRNVDYINPTTNKMTNPSGAQAPNWQSASQVSDWASIHSYKIVLKPGKVIPAGASFDFNYNMTAPTTLAPELLNPATPDEQRAAWNSFAVAQDDMQVVEPLRVGVVITGQELPEPVLPDISKTVNQDPDKKLLADRGEEFTWEVKVDMNESTGTWTQAKIEDIVHSDLDIVSYKLATDIQGNNDVSNLGSFAEVVDNKVLFTFNDNGSGSYEHLANQTYYLIIKAKIKDSVTDDKLNEHIQAGGIPNKGTIHYGNAGDKKDSNIPVVIPPTPAPPAEPKQPDISKTVNQDPDKKLLADRGEEFTWEVKVDMNESTGTWSQAKIEDIVHSDLDIVSYKLATDIQGNNDVSNLGSFAEVVDNKVLFTFNDNGSGSYEHLANKTYYLIIKAKIKDSVTDDKLNEHIQAGGIPNKGTIHYGNAGDKKDSNIPVVIPPTPTPPGEPKQPDISKTVNQDPLKRILTNRGEEFTWEVKVDMNESAGTWTQAKIEDIVHSDLDIVSYKLATDIQGNNDVSNLGSFAEVVDNKVLFTFNDNGSGSYEHLANQTYYLIIKAKIKDSVTDDKLNEHIQAGGIPNKGTIHYGNAGDKKDSNIPVVIPPTPTPPGEPKQPDISKTVNQDPLKRILTNRGEEFTWEVKVDMNESTGTWTQAKIEDIVHSDLDIVSYKLATDIQGNNDVSNLGSFAEVVDNKVLFTFNDNGSGSYEHLANQTYYLIIKAKIKDSVTDDKLNEHIQAGGIPNKGTIHYGNAGDKKDSNIPVVIPPTPPANPEVPVIEKTVNQDPINQELANRDELFTWEVKVDMGPSAATWTQAKITDNVHEHLDVVSFKLSSNIDGSDDVSNLGHFNDTSGNNVVFTFNDNGSGSFEHLTNQTYYLIIQAKINKDVTDDQLRSHITAGGIPNKGVLHFGNEGDSVFSNEPRVIPPTPPVLIPPTIEKSVNGDPVRQDLTNRDDLFTWEVKVDMGPSTSTWSQAKITDNVHEHLDVVSYKLSSNVDGSDDVSNLGHFNDTSGNNVVFTFNDNGSGSFEHLTNQTYYLIIQAKINKDVTDDQLRSHITAGGIPNKGVLHFGNEGDSVFSNEPRVIPPTPPVLIPPTIEKSVNGDPVRQELTNRDELFTWEVKVDMGPSTSTWSQAKITDSVHEHLDVVSYKLSSNVDGSDDVSNLGHFNDTSGNNVVFTFNDNGSGSFEHLTNQTYYLIIEARINKDVTDDQLKDHIFAGGILNEGTIHFGNEGQFINSNKPAVIPPTPPADPDAPVIEKTVNQDPLKQELANRDELFTWEVKVDMGPSASTWTQASIVDQVHEHLDVVSYKLTTDILGQNDVSNLGSFAEVVDNKVLFTFNDNGSGSFEHLTNQTYYLIIEARINKNVTDDQLRSHITAGGIPNRGVLHFGNEGDSVFSNEPRVTPPAPPVLIPPTIEKSVNGDPVRQELTNRDELFTWEVKVDMGPSASTWSQAKITDTVHEHLDVVSYKLATDILGQNDVSNLGHFNDTNGNNVVFTFNDNGSGSFEHLTNQTYYLIIEARINKDVTDDQLKGHILAGGILNEGTIHFGNEGQFINSNKPVVIPPTPPVDPDEPVIEKTVNQDPIKQELANRDELFTWEVKVDMGPNAATWTQASIVDQVHDYLDVVSYKLTSDIEGNNDVSNLGHFDANDGNKVVFTFNDNGSGSYEHLTNQTYYLIIQAKIKDSITDGQLAPYILAGGIPNKGVLNFGNEGDSVFSNEPRVTPPAPPVLIPPTIEKSVNGDPTKQQLTNRDEVFTWEVKVDMGPSASTWSQAKITDTVHEHLDVISYKLSTTIDGSDDVSDLGHFNDTNGNSVVFTFNDNGSGSFEHLTNQTYYLIIEAKINKDVTDNQLADHILDGGIPNEGVIHFGNDGQFIKSNKPVVIPPALVPPTIDKSVNGNPIRQDLADRDEEFTWEVKVDMKESAGTWKQASIVDTVHEFLDVISYKLSTDINGDNDVSHLGHFDATVGNQVVFTFNDNGSGSYEHLANQTYYLIIKAKINEDVTNEQLAPYILSGGIPNQGRLNFGNDGQFIVSNLPVVTPPDALDPEIPVIGKTVNDEHNITLENRDELFTWKLTTRFGNATADWTQAIIVDEVHELLDVVEYRLVDLQGNDMSHLGSFEATQGNKVVFTFDKQDDSYAYLSEQTLVLEIDAKINIDVTDEQLAPYIQSGGIPNQGRLEFGNEGDVVHSNIPKVTPPAPELPVIEKSVNGEQRYGLSNRNEKFEWQVRTSMGNTTASWTSASIVDEIHEYLDVISYKLVDANGDEVVDLGHFDETVGNKVVYTFTQVDGSFAHLANQTYTLLIEAKINDDITDEQLLPFIEQGGIPNQGRLNFGNDGQFIDSNIPRVTPPDLVPPMPELPVIEKTVNGDPVKQELADRDELFTWEVKVDMGPSAGSWSHASIVDEVNKLLDVVSFKLSSDINGSDDVSHLGVFAEVVDNKVVFTFNDNGSGSYEHLANQTYYLIIEAKINEDVTDEQLAPYILTGIPNQGRLNFGNDGQFIDSNVPVVTPPDKLDPEIPVIGKTVNEEHNITLENRDELFTWELTTRFGNATADWTQAIIVDEVHELLDVVEYRLVDLQGNDVSHLGNFEATQGNKIVFTFDKQDDSYAYLSGQTLVLEIDAKINPDVTDEQLAPYIQSGGIPNQGRLEFGNEGDVVHSNIPKVTPPPVVPVPPVIEKSVNGQERFGLSNRNEVFEWQVKTSMGSSTANWTSASIVDEIHEYLDVISYKLVDANGDEVVDLGHFDETVGNKVVYTFTQIDGSFAHLANQTYTLLIEAKINDDITDEQLLPYIEEGGIPNQGRLNFGNDGQFIDSNIPRVTPPDLLPPNPQLPVIEKTVNGDPIKRELANRDELFTWEVKVDMGPDAGTWSQASIVDEVHEFLDVVSYKVSTDINGSDDVSYLGHFDATEGNRVVFTFDDNGSGSFDHLSNQTYYLIIEAQINSDVTDEQLAPYILTGIPNQGRLNFGNDGQFIDSNVPVVTPPDTLDPEIPVIGKTVNDKHNITLENRDEMFTWKLTTRFGNATADWTQATIVDEVHELLDVVEYRLVDLQGNDMSHLGSFEATQGNKVVFTFDKQDDSYAYLSKQTLVLEIDAKINPDVTDEQLAPYILSGGIPNQGRLEFGNDGDVVHSNIPKVTPPVPPIVPRLPEIEKTVNGNPISHILANRDEIFTWEVKTLMGNTTTEWTHASIVDEVHELLDVVSYKLLDVEGNDMSHLGHFDATEGNKVIFTFEAVDGSFAHLANQNYMLLIEAKINSDVTDEQLAPYIIAGGIPNRGRLNFGNDGQFIDSNVPVVTPPVSITPDPECPSIGKTINGGQMLKLENRDELFTWEITTRFGNKTSTWTQAAIVDDVHEYLDVVAYRVLDQDGNDVSHLGEFKNSGNTVRFEFSLQDGTYEYLANQILTLEIDSVINNSITDEQLLPYIQAGGIPNQGRLEFGNNGDVIYTNLPVVYPPINVHIPVLPPVNPGPKLPNTGASANFIALAMLSIIGTGLVVLSRKKRENK